MLVGPVFWLVGWVGGDWFKKKKGVYYLLVESEWSGVQMASAEVAYDSVVRVPQASYK